MPGTGAGGQLADVVKPLDKVATSLKINGDAGRGREGNLYWKRPNGRFQCEAEHKLWVLFIDRTHRCHLNQQVGEHV